MNIGLFMQNVKKGGLDTFVLQLARAWPFAENLIVFCNRSHPGLDDLRRGLPAGVRLVSYDFLLANDLAVRLGNASRLLTVLCRGAFWLTGFPWQVRQCRKLLRGHGLDRLMVINGGYPGGDACLAATVAWAHLTRAERAWHNFHNLALSYPQSPLRRIKEKLVDALVARSAAGFVSVSQACLASLARQRPVFTDRPAGAIYNGIDALTAERRTDLRAELGLPPHSRIVLMLGVYEPRKGHAFAISVMESVARYLPDAWLLACGDGNDAEIQAVQAVRDASPVRTHVLLQRHRHDLPNLLAQVDLLIMPSQAQESFGYAVVEAMACGLPVVVSDVGGLPEVVADGLTGHVVRHDDAETFAGHVIALLRDPSLARRMGEAGRRRYHEKFQAARMGAQYHRLLVQGTFQQAPMALPHPAEIPDQ